MRTTRSKTAAKVLAGYQSMGRSGPAGFLDLPSELRNTIYELAFSKSVDIWVTSIHQRPNGRWSAVFTPTPALLLTCKKVHKEAIVAYYQFSKFVAQNPNIADYWSNHIPKNYLAAVTFMRAHGGGNDQYMAEYFRERAKKLGVDLSSAQLGVFYTREPEAPKKQWPLYQ